MGKKPYLQLYPGDWLREPGTRAMSCAAVGAYVNLLMFLDGTPTRGRLRGTPEYIRRLTGAEKSEWPALFLEWRKARVLDFVTHRNGEITVKSRRMVREEKERKSNLDRQLRYRETHKRKSNGESNSKNDGPAQKNNAVSSSSSSISSSLRVKKEKSAPKEKLPFGEEGLVMLSQPEYEKLLANPDFGPDGTKDYIQRATEHFGKIGPKATARKYHSHYLTILSWKRLDNQKRQDRLGQAKIMIDEILQKHDIPERVGEVVLHIVGLFPRWSINKANLAHWCWEMRALGETGLQTVVKRVAAGPEGPEPSKRILADTMKLFWE